MSVSAPSLLMVPTLSLRSRMEGFSMRDFIRLSAMFLLMTTPFTYYDLELSSQLIIFILMKELKFMESLRTLDEGRTLSTALCTNCRSLLPHFF